MPSPCVPKRLRRSTLRRLLVPDDAVNDPASESLVGVLWFDNHEGAVV